MNRRIAFSLVLVSTTMLAMGRRVEAPEPDEEGIKMVIDANNRFCLELFKELRNTQPGNIFFSPFSISMAMAMVYEGARSNTQEEIQSVFRFPVDDGKRQLSFSAVYQGLNKKEAKYKLNTANALWVQKDYRLLPEYLETVKKNYYGNAQNVDFISATEDARVMINRWVAERTNDKIKDLFPPGSLESSSRLVVTNAIYFKGNWVSQFDKDLTEEADFRVDSTRTIKAQMMKRTDAKSRYEYLETEKLQVLEMPYEGEDLSMLILLPKDDDLNSFEESLTIERINEWRAQLSMCRIDVHVPRFTFKTKYLLNDCLAEMGMPSAFSARADLSGINGIGSLFIQTVVHEAYVDVNEEGTEAAAATGVAVGITSVMPRVPVFRADHPFIFLIQEKQSGNILFYGRVAEPLES